LFVVTEKAMEKRVVMKEGFKCYSLPIKGFLGKSLLQRLVFPQFFIISILLFVFILVRRRPRVIIGTGGYASFVPLFLGVLLGIPTIISEQDSYPGLTTKLLSRYVTDVHIAHENARHYLKAKRCILSGNPLRDSIFEGKYQDAMEFFNLDEKKKTVLILGGSHGARSINRVFIEVIKNQASSEIEYIFQTGKDDYQWIKESLKDIKVNVRIFSFIERMNLAYTAADLVFSRAGALATAEITARGIPSVLIPYPYATGAHQEKNARYLEKMGASVMLLDSELSEEKVKHLLITLLGDEKRLKNMEKNALSLCRKDAANKIALRILSLSRGKRYVS